MIQKIIDDTLKFNGKWSRKSLTMFASFVMANLVGLWIVVSNYITANPVNEYAIEVFYGFLLLAGGTSFLTVYDKLKGKQIQNKNTEK